MSFRRIPFQFTTTDPAERHAELLRRFGVPKEDEMLVETPNSPGMDGFCGPSSPRLQHRLPNFMAEGKESCSKENGADNVDSGKASPRVRVIPIQLESATSDKSNRQRTRSGGSIHNSHLVPEDKAKSSSNSSLPVSHDPECSDQERHVPGEKGASSAKPKVYNIPVFVEGRDDKASTNKQKVNVTNIPVQRVSTLPKKQNGPCVSKSSRKPEKPREEPKSPLEISMNQIAAVLKELESYKAGVENFCGVQGDKQYRYLDEMLTRCMLKLDDVETHGNEDVRKARKSAVREVEKYAGILDSKVKVPVSEAAPMAESAGTTQLTENTCEETEMESKICEDVSKETMEGTGEMKSCENGMGGDCKADSVQCKATENQESEAYEMELEEKVLENVVDVPVEVPCEQKDSAKSGESVMNVETVYDAEMTVATNVDTSELEDKMEVESLSAGNQENLKESCNLESSALQVDETNESFAEQGNVDQGTEELKNS